MWLSVLLVVILRIVYEWGAGVDAQLHEWMDNGAPVLLPCAKTLLEFPRGNRLTELIIYYMKKTILRGCDLVYVRLLSFNPCSACYRITAQRLSSEENAPNGVTFLKTIVLSEHFGFNFFVKKWHFMYEINCNKPSVHMLSSCFIFISAILSAQTILLSIK